MEHTPEPWNVIEFYMSGERIGVEPKEGDMIGFFHDKSERTKANARRIVACVNACKNIPTDVLESDPNIAEVIIEAVAVEEHRDEIMRQNFELISALERVEKWLETHNIGCLPDSEKELIQRAKGGAA